MNQNPTPHWSPIVSTAEDDFASFLDFGDLNFAAFDSIPQDEPGLQQQNGFAPMDTSMEGNAGMLPLGQANIQQQMGQNGGALSIDGLHGFADPFPDLVMQPELLEQQKVQHHQQQQLHMQHQSYRLNNVVPPTPNSVEIHGGHSCYYKPPADAQQAQMYEHYRRQPRDQLTFTPLVSPAVTPLDEAFQYPSYAAPTDAFSPLTSPALRAQNQQLGGQRSVYGAARYSDTPDAVSPSDQNADYTVPPPSSTPVTLRKSKRKTSSASTKNPTRVVRQSPAMKPQRKKHSASTIIPPKEVSGIIEEARKAKQAQGVEGKLPFPYSQDSSGADSVSPEPLSEILMPPPATPKSTSASRSPCLNAKQGQPRTATTKDATGEAATPASLMRIRKQGKKSNGYQHRSTSLKEQTSLGQESAEQTMEDIILPDLAGTSKRPALRPINTTEANKDEQTPALPANKDPVNGSVSAPITATGSAFPSPSASALASPTATGINRRGDLKHRGRDPKKRNSQSSVQASPALRPKISPSIKPLLPEGAVVTAETSALLLASKSNYQNILEGTHLPGVSYPENLSTNLTSKRTSHKIAEQGRRNRINVALQEIASLLPSSHPKNGSLGGQVSPNTMMTSGTAAQQSNSKASTVELAIEYIKSLQQELVEVKGRLEAMENEKEKGVGMEGKVGTETKAACASSA